jgi:hypothetical protein
MQTITSASDLYFPEAEVRSQRTEIGNPSYPRNPRLKLVATGRFWYGKLQLHRFAALRPFPHLLCVRSSRRAKNPELAEVHFVAEQFLNLF